ncbi:Nn.00g027770.m01.CDS01 [Neocucurbitaria sp. VM-36]
MITPELRPAAAMFHSGVHPRAIVFAVPRLLEEKSHAVRGGRDQYLTPPAITTLPGEFDEAVKAFERSSQQCVNYETRLDHVSPNPIYHPQYVRAEQGAMDMNRSIAEFASTAARYGHPSLNNLANLIRMSSSPYISDPVRVAVIGGVGQGKSYLIGALLGDMHIVKDGNSGESMTRVVIEYHHAPTSGYSAQITLSPWEAVEARLKRSFQHLMNGVFLSKEEIDSEIIDQKMKTAQEVFKALFPSRPNFWDDAAIKEYLPVSEQPTIRPEFRDEILQSAHMLYDNIYGGIAAQSEDDGNVVRWNPWPFVELVSIGGAFAVTEKKVILADTPGRTLPQIIIPSTTDRSQDVQINSRSQTKFALEEGHMLEYLKREKVRFEQELRRLQSPSNERQLQLVEFCLRLVKFKAEKARCCEDNRDYYFNSAMRKVYEKSSHARKQSENSNLHQVRSETFKNELCTLDTSPYRQIHIMLKQAFNDERDAVKALFATEMGAIFQDIAEEFERLQETQSQQGGQAIEQRAVQANAVKEAKVVLNTLEDMLAGSGVNFEG